MSNRIIWSDIAKQDLIQIKRFYDKRNQSSVYSTKLIKVFRDATKIISKYPFLSIRSDKVNVRAFIVHNYIIFFENKQDCIFILTIWDSKRNPDQLKYILNL